jgi:hypothetical protein
MKRIYYERLIDEIIDNSNDNETKKRELKRLMYKIYVSNFNDSDRIIEEILEASDSDDEDL